MRSPHLLHGVSDMTPLVSLLHVTHALATLDLLGGLSDSLEAVLLDHLPRDRVNLRLRYHVALPKFRHSWRRGDPRLTRHRGVFQTAQLQLSFLPLPNKALTLHLRHVFYTSR
jgi:hypothetical protein